MTPEDRDRLHSLIYDEDGVLHGDVQREVEAVIKEYPDTQAPHWLGGVAAINTVMRRLGLYHEER